MRALAALLLLLAGPAAAQAQADRPAAAARAARHLATADETLATGGADLAAAALVDYEQAAAWAAEGRASQTYARARLGKARALEALGQTGEALGALEEAVATARSAGLDELLAELLGEDARLTEDMGLLDRAVRSLRESALVLDRLGRTEAAVDAMLRLADLELARDGRRSAIPALEFAHDRARSAGLPGAQEAALEAKAEILLALGDFEGARATAEELLGLHAAASDGPPVVALLLLGRSLRSAELHEQALPILADAASLCAELGGARCELEARELLAACLLELERPRDAVPEVLALVAASRTAGDAAAEMRGHYGLSRAFRRLGRLEPALSSLAEAERLAQSDAPDHVRAALAVERAQLLVASRRTLEAAAAWDAGLELASRPEDDRPWAASPAGWLELPARERLEREQLDFLVEAGLWARALTTCASCLEGGDRDAVDLETLREITLQQDATLLTWRALDDSLLAWALTPDGRLLGGRVEGLGARALAALAEEAAGLAPLVELPGEGVAAEELRRTLRRLHDALLGPVEPALPETGEALLLRAPPQLDGLPWGLLLDEEGRFLGERHGLAELSSLARPPRRAGGGSLRIVADLRDPEHPGMDLRRLVARLDGEQRRRDEAAAAAAAAQEQDGRGRSRDAPGRRSGSGPPAPPPPPEPLAGERRYAGELVVLGGAGWIPERVTELAPAAGLLLLHAGCAELEPPPLDGALVALPSCHGEAAEAAASALLDGGARAVIVLRWDPGESRREALAGGLLAVLEPGVAPAEGLAAAAGAGLPTQAWGALRLLGSAR